MKRLKYFLEFLYKVQKKPLLYYFIYWIVDEIVFFFVLVSLAEKGQLSHGILVTIFF